MQPGKIQICEKDINYAEKILLRSGKHFDLERKDFIRNLDTVDLQAVPGSGKTTALLAKLLILEQYLPFDDGSGILVISHTNAAVNEIRNKIGRFCPKIFSYPNFVGTIQSFVDQFLAAPFYSVKYGKKIWRIDNDIFEEKHYIPGKARGWLTNQPNQDEILIKSRLIEDDLLDYGFDLNRKFPLTNEGSETYKALVRLKKDIREKGVLTYDDAYILAREYVSRYPLIKKLLQKRFRFVFVDEMQDMEPHQHDLLEELFYKKFTLRHIYQRIGDKNQAIFSGEVKIDEVWKKREKELRLRGSHRLTPQTAELVKYFGIDYCEIDGRKTNEDGSALEIKPYLIIFDDSTIDKVIEKFTEIIEELRQSGKIPEQTDLAIKAIGWRTEHEDEGNLAIKDYHQEYERYENTPRIDYINLISYLKLYDKKKNSLKAIRENILNGILKILRLEDIHNEQERNYTKSSFLLHLRETQPQLYEDLKLQIFKWSKAIYQGLTVETHNEMKPYIQQMLLDVFSKNELTQGTIKFLESNDASEPATTLGTIKEQKNIYIGDNGTKVDIGTIHSIKGETHLATLYMETYYYCDGSGPTAKSYEAQRLKRQFEGNILRASDGVRVKQSAKMVYVGFSRPTHLLCFAVHKDRVPDVDPDDWEIIEISTQ